MSGALETAAGAFAVVGVADVLVRTGRQVYGFLADIRDAPNEIEKLRDSIYETTLLAAASKECLDELGSHAAPMTRPIGQLTAARKSLTRELQSLINLFGKYKGTKKTWSSVKYVLDERKIAKALQNLERSKTALISGLVLAGKHISSSGHQKIEQRIQQCFDQLRDRVDLHQAATMIALNSQFQRLSSKKDNEKQHDQTRELVSMNYLDIKNTLQSMARTLTQQCPVGPKKSNREIYFSGERPDMLMAHLLPLRDALGSAIDNLLLTNTENLSPRHIGWLQSEVEHLIGSAAQQEASRYFASTATSFDEWIYNSPGCQKHQKGLGCTSDKKGTISSQSRWKERSRPAGKEVRVATPSGRLRIRAPQYNSAVTRTHGDEVRLLYMQTDERGAVAIDARFFQHMVDGMQPKLYAQLNAFVLDLDFTNYDRLFRKADIKDIDAAFRSGYISPYSVNRDGAIICLYVAAAYGRLDVLQYLESQGLGMYSLGGYDTVILGTVAGSLLGAVPDVASHLDIFHSIKDNLLVNEEDAVSYRTRLTQLNEDFNSASDSLMLMLDMYAYGYDYTMRAMLLRSVYHKERLSRGLLERLVEMGADVEYFDDDEGNLIQYLIKKFEENWENAIFEEKLDAFIHVGVDIHYRDKDGWSPSTYARYYNVWDIWCRALECNGMRIEDVLKEEGSSWLLEEDWVETWNVKFGKTHYIHNY